MRSCARPEQSAGHKIASAVFIHYMTSFYSLLIRGFGEPPLIKALRPDRAISFVAGLFFYWSRREHRANIPLCREKSMHVRQRVNKKKNLHHTCSFRYLLLIETRHFTRDSHFINPYFKTKSYGLIMILFFATLKWNYSKIILDGKYELYNQFMLNVPVYFKMFKNGIWEFGTFACNGFKANLVEFLDFFLTSYFQPCMIN